MARQLIEVEVRRLDPWTWALYQAVATGLFSWIPVLFYGLALESLTILVLGWPATILFAYVGGLMGSALINFVIGLMAQGPTLFVRTADLAGGNGWRGEKGEPPPDSDVIAAMQNRDVLPEGFPEGDEPSENLPL